MEEEKPSKGDIHLSVNQKRRQNLKATEQKNPQIP